MIIFLKRKDCFFVSFCVIVYNFGLYECNRVKATVKLMNIHWQFRIIITCQNEFHKHLKHTDVDMEHKKIIKQ